MNTLYDLSLKLNTLTVFRNILEDDAIKELLNLSQAASTHLHVSEIVSSYSSFVSALFKNSSSFSDYIKELVVNDENFYIIGKGKGETFDDVIEAAVAKELEYLSELASLTSAEVKSHLTFDGFLPDWRTESLDISEIYAEHVALLSSQGYGMFAKYYAFALTDAGISPIKNPDPQTLSELGGYERERNLVIQNTLALIDGRGANNVLLYGDAGTGKSSTIKAILNEYKDRGLRLIEVKKDCLIYLSDLLELLWGNPLKFILFIDDLSFSGNDDSFAALKAVLEGSIACRSKNVALYATSNRRHLLKENMSDRMGDDLHLSDTIQENLSLSARFGLTVTFQAPAKDDYIEIAAKLAAEAGLVLSDKELSVKAEAFAIRNGGRSPRTAKHFVEVESVLQWEE